MKTCLALGFVLACSAPVLADETESRAFGGGVLTIGENSDGEKVLGFDGRQLAAGYFLVFEQAAVVEDQPVMLYAAGDGGNACGPASVIVWKPEDRPVEAVSIGEDCGAPSPAVSSERIVYLPYVLPGSSEPVETWSPSAGLVLAGRLDFAPEPGTGWADLENKPVGHPMDYFSNAAFYKQAQALLGEDLGVVAQALSVSSEPEADSGLQIARGCVPHACTISDGFVAVDVKARAIWFAQMRGSSFAHWPKLAEWPKPVRAAFDAAFAE